MPVIYCVSKVLLILLDLSLESRFNKNIKRILRLNKLTEANRIEMTIESQFATFVYIATAISVIFVIVGAITSFKGSFGLREKDVGESKTRKVKSFSLFSSLW